MSIEDLIREASGGRARLMSGKDALGLLSGILGKDEGSPKGKFGMPEDLLKDTNCGREDCELHGELNKEQPYQITDTDLELLSADDAYTHMISATASAHNALLAGKHTAAIISQTQAMLWERIATRLTEAEGLQSLARVQEQGERLTEENSNKHSIDGE